ncbi:MAG: DUF922 domain-containing protein, partial [Kiritimatiellae bacterium]|nr:DUF922 domain-containing protein [Kiritimatiellia bacterium]
VVDANGAVTAHYEYAPFGNVTVTIGSLVSANRFRFSSEYADDALGLVYYNYRHYEPVTGRWMGREMFLSSLVRNLFCFVGNLPLSKIDVWGLFQIKWEDVDDLDIPPFHSDAKYAEWTGEVTIDYNYNIYSTKKERVDTTVCPNGCRYRRFASCKYTATVVDSTIHMPKWTQLDKAPPEIGKIWKRTLQLLKEHEGKHAKVGENFQRTGVVNVEGVGCDLNSADSKVKSECDNMSKQKLSEYQKEFDELQDLVDREDVVSLQVVNGRPVKVTHNGEDFFE